MICGLLSERQAPQLRYVRREFAYAAIGILVALNSLKNTNSSLEVLLDEGMWTAYAAGTGATPGASVGPACGRVSGLSKKYLPSQSLKNFVLQFREAADSKEAYFFWYGLFNVNIMDYYTAQADQKGLITVQDRSPKDEYVWYTSLNPKRVVSETWFREWLLNMFCKGELHCHPGASERV